MGVSGSGKSTIGKMLANKLEIPFVDADDLHPESNRFKMSQGIALTDADRWPWLDLVKRVLFEHQYQNGCIMACSALKESYREYLLNEGLNDIRWVYLKGSEELIAQRLRERKNHFFNQSLLRSQFETLEEPKNAYEIEIGESPEQICEMIIEKLQNE